MHQEVIRGYRLAPQQKLLWLHQRRLASPFQVQCALLLEGKVRLEVLRACLVGVVNRHEALRTTFNHLPGMKLPVQVVHESGELYIREVDSINWDPEVDIDAALREERHEPFDLENGPMVRFVLHRIADNRHVLIVTLPSLCADEISLQNIFSEITGSYRGYLGGDDTRDEAPRYIQFSEWQNNLMEEDESAEGKRFWMALDLAKTSRLTLPFENEVTSDGPFEPQVLKMTLGSDLVQRIGTAAAERTMAIDVFLLTCWESLLRRLAGEQEITVNTHCDGRIYEEMESGVGLYARWLPVRNRFAEPTRFSDALASIDTYVSGALGWQEYFSREHYMSGDRNSALGEGAGPPISFAYEERPSSQWVGSLELSVVGGFTCTDLFKLKLVCVQAGDRLALEFHYDPLYYTADAVDRISRQFGACVESVLEEPDGQINFLNIVDESARHQMLVEWNDTAIEPVPTGCLHQLFELQVERDPDAVALSFEGDFLTYAELNRRANRLSHLLRRHGAGPETRIVLLMERSIDGVIGALAALKTGASYIPLDPAQPRTRIAFMIEDANAELVLTQKRLGFSHPANECTVICVDADAERIENESEDNPGVSVLPDNLAYLIYTSGSTGKPKGVMIKHGSVVNLLEALERRVYSESAPRLKVSLNAPLAFDSSVKQLYQLTRGHSIYIVPEEARPDGHELLSFVRRESLDVLDCTPSQLRLLVDAGLASHEQAPSLFLVGGEAIDNDLWKRLSEIQASAFHNVYGPTECTVDATAARVSYDLRQPTIGRALANTRVHILDQRLNPIPVGVPGEIYIGGAGLARGYSGRPDLSADKFIPDPFGESAGSRIYKTGDLARFLPDGGIEFIGRIDSQVKIRGSRIELGEVESAIREHPQVSETVVVAGDDGRGDKRLIAYIVPVKGRGPSISDLYGFVKERLPEYMVPSAFVVLDRLPLTPNGKVDRKSLPAPDIGRPDLATGYEGARTEVEELMISIFASVLGIERIGVHDNFFELGGHSLLATQITSRIRQTFRVEMPLRTVFETPTIEGLAANIDRAMKAGSAADLPLLRSVSREKPLPLSFSQQRLWFLDQLDEGGGAYNVPAAVRLRGPLNVDTLKRALTEVVSRHEVLCTVFDSYQGQPVQVIGSVPALELPVVNLSEVPKDEREDEAQRWLRDESQHSFDLKQGPLFKATLIKLADEEHILSLMLHHIVFDAWSIGVLHREMGALYEAISRQSPAALPDLPIQYADYAAWQRECLEGESLRNEMNYWRQQLDGNTLLELPSDYPRQRDQTFRGAHSSFDLPDSLFTSLSDLGRRENATIFMTLLSAFQVLLYRYTMQEDVSVGTPVANRNHSEVEGLIGFFLNTLVMRTNLGGDPTFRDLLARVREVALGAYAHQNLPFEKLVEELQPERQINRTPFFQVMFALRSVPQQEMKCAGLVMEPVLVESGTSKFDLLLFVDETPHGLKAVFEYNTDLFAPDTIERLGSHFLGLLESIVSDPSLPIARLSMLSDRERDQVIVGWNRTAGDYPKQQCLQQVFESQVQRTPDAIALTFEDEQVTYQELNRKSNQLAHYLRRLGAGPDLFVGIMMERSLEMMYAVLGTLKAGAAYVGLDPVYPRERLAMILEDTGAKVVLTKSYLRDRLPDCQALAISVDEERDAIACESEYDNDAGAVSDNLAYVTYTSGSTGKPKGIAMPHSAVRNLLEWMVTETVLPPDSRTLQFASLSFDVSFQEMFSTWGMGGALVLITGEARSEISGLARVLQEKAIRRLFMASVALQQLAEGFCELETKSAALRKVIAGSEQLQITRSIASMFGDLGNCSLHNEYGPSETHVVTELALLPDSNADWPERPCVGKPILNSQIYMLDHCMQPVPIGIPGELFVGGAGIARCYLNRPELVADRFIPDPFGREPGARLYKSGDLARWLPSGDIEFLGRIDFQVKIRGFRVEPGEIEGVLGGHPLIREVVVLAREDVPGDRRLVAYLVSDSKNVPTVIELRKFLAERLPDYMIPSAFVALDALPLTPNGKVNRRALPAPDHARPELGRAYTPPRNAVEDVLATYWAEVLNIERVGIDDNFFELGGHSLLATQLVSRLRDEFQIDVRLRSLFQAPTVAGLAEEMWRGSAQENHLEEIAQSLIELRSLSDEEAAALLNHEMVR